TPNTASPATLRYMLHLPGIVAGNTADRVWGTGDRGQQRGAGPDAKWHRPAGCLPAGPWQSPDRSGYFLLRSVKRMWRKVTSIGGPAWSCSAMMPSSGILGNSWSTVVTPLTRIVTCLPT